MLDGQQHNDWDLQMRSILEKGQEEVPFCNHTIVNPQLDRHKPLHENKDVFVRAVGERDNGIIVRPYVTMKDTLERVYGEHKYFKMLDREISHLKCFC